MSAKSNSGSGVICVRLRKDKYFVWSLNPDGAQWLRDFSEQNRLVGESLPIDPRFINELLDAAQAAQVEVIYNT